MSDDHNVVDQALDLFVYAPIGLALEAREIIPKLAQRGRGQVALARVASRFAASKGQRQARRLVDDLLDKDPRGESDLPDSTDSPELPWAGYDELTAREVVSRLNDVDEPTLAAVLRYEEHHRRRATIINRVQQLRRT